MLTTKSLSPEFLLAAACCRWPPSQARVLAVRKAASGGIDWRRFLRVVRRQRVEGLVNDAFVRAGVSVPADIATALADAAREIARQNLAFTAESLRLQRVFDEGDVPLLFIKGIPLSMLAYGTLTVKKAWDIDAAVSADQVAKACALLSGAGYERIEPGPELSDRQFETWLTLSKESVWRHEHKAIVVELHSGLVDNPMLLPDVSASSARQQVAVAPGHSLPTLRKDEHFSYICVHGATHAWSRLKWIADVSALLKSDGPDEVERLYRRSLDLGAGRCSAQALLLCSDLFQLVLPSALERELRSDPVAGRLVRIALRMMAGRNEARELDDGILSTVPIHYSHFLLRCGWRYKWAELRRKLFSPHDRSKLALRRPLRFLYPLILVPSWLLRRARGVRVH